MKFMKLGMHPDTFYTEEATRTLVSDVPTDLTIQINGISYLLHKSSLVPKCGLLQRLCSERDNASVDLNNVPGGEEAFELCAKVCYGITINLSAHNFVPAFCAANFLRMTEKVENGNFVMKLEAFFSSCILQRWKDSLLTLQSAERVLLEWSENLCIVRRCIDSVVDKILTPPPKVTWSYTYTRPGYIRKRHDSVPKDWWTEDVSCLGIDLFSTVLSTINSTSMLQPRLIGEALHVYAQCWLLNLSETSTSQRQHSPNTKRKILETIVSLIPAEKGSVSIKFLLRLLSTTSILGASPVTRAELLRLCGLQLDEATSDDLLLPTQSPSTASHDVDLVKTVVRSFLRQWKRQAPAVESQSLRLIHKVGMLVDSYLQIVAKDAKFPAQKMVSLIETLPGIARPQHDHLYKAINIYLKEHPDVIKADKKHLCSFLDCQKLSPEIRSHAVKNEHLPLRTVVQVILFEQEKSSTTVNRKHTHSQHLQTSVTRDDLSKLKLTAADEQSSKANGTRPLAPGTSALLHQPSKKLDDKPQLIQELSFKVKPETEKEKEREVAGDRIPHNKAQMRSVSKITYIKR